MQNNDLIGNLVLSKAGRDRGNTYIIIEVLNNDYVLVANGDNKTIKEPKKKNLKHLTLIDNKEVNICRAISNNENSTNLMIKKYLKVKGIVKEG